MVSVNGQRRLLGVRLDRRDALVAVVLLLACAAAWHVCYRKWPTELSHPVEYNWDAMFQLGAARAAADRGLGALWGAPSPRLGAPAGARWSDFPMSEDVVYLGLGLMQRAFGPNLGMNLSFIGIGVLAAWCMYWVARRLRLSRRAAALVGALFAMSPYLYWRNLHHVNLTIYWHLPLVFVLWLWASSRRGLDVRHPRFKVALGIAALVAVHNNYYLNYALQVLLLIAVLQAARRRWAAARGALVVLAAAMGVFLLVNADTLYGLWSRGPNPEAVQRSIQDTVRFGLRPMELFIPSPLHRIPPLDHWGAVYRPQGTGEFPSPFLGFVGIVGCLVMVVLGLRGAVFAGGRGLATRGLVFSAWLVWVAVPGGLMHLAQLAVGFTAFRSNNRVSILIMGLSLLVFGRLLDRGLRRLPLAAGAALTVGLGVFGLWEQSPDVRKLGNIEGTHAGFLARARSDEALAARLERELPEGAAVMMWPPLAFPEAGGFGGVPDYDYFRPYLYSRTLRFSYGAMKGRPEARYAVTAAQLPPAEAIAQLDRDGFRAVLFHLGGASSQQVQAWAQGAQAVKPVRVFVSDAQDFAVVAW